LNRPPQPNATAAPGEQHSGTAREPVPSGARTPGSPAWRRKRLRELAWLLSDPAFLPLRAAVSERGLTMTEVLNRLVDAIATWPPKKQRQAPRYHRAVIDLALDMAGAQKPCPVKTQPAPPPEPPMFDFRSPSRRLRRP
jgi:hypothetical protein